MKSTYSITELHQSFISKAKRPSEIVEEMIRTIKTRDPEIKAYTSVFEDEARAEAKAIDDKIDQGKSIGILEGIPISIKDIILIKDQPCTASAEILRNYTAVYDATVITRLRQAGVIFMGKTNLDEFAMGSSTENSAFYPTRNPHDPERVPGGSSGGSAASVAAQMCAGSLGTDTGGSIRQPAAFTGIVGLKPTYGRVSRFGAIAMASSLDQIGPFAHTVLDTAHILTVIEGHDPMDATSVKLTQEQMLDISKIEQGNVEGLRIGLPREYFVDGIDPEIRSAIDEVIETYRSLGAEIVSISLPYSQYAIPTYYILMPAEVSTNLARFDGIKYGLSLFDQSPDLMSVYLNSRTQGFGAESMRRIMLGSYVLSSGYYDAYYAKAKQSQALIKHDFERAFQEVDLILTPTTPHTAFKLGDKVSDPISMYLEDIFTVATNLAGIPGISIPAKPDGNSQIGFQLMAKHFNEQTLLTAGHGYQKRTKTNH